SMWGEEVPWKWALLIQAVTAGALKYELHIPTVVIPGSDHNPPSNQGGIHENQA
ncbi:Cro/CI family transcriptional regulator, partial [Escherichia coli]